MDASVADSPTDASAAAALADGPMDASVADSPADASAAAALADGPMDASVADSPADAPAVDGPTKGRGRPEGRVLIWETYEASIAMDIDIRGVKGGIAQLDDFMRAIVSSVRKKEGWSASAESKSTISIKYRSCTVYVDLKPDAWDRLDWFKLEGRFIHCPVTPMHTASMFMYKAEKVRDKLKKTVCLLSKNDKRFQRWEFGVPCGE